MIGLRADAAGKGRCGGGGGMREGWGWLMESARVEDAPQQHVQMFTNRKTATKSARLSYMMEETERRTNRARKKSQKEWNKKTPKF